MLSILDKVHTPFLCLLLFQLSSLKIRVDVPGYIHTPYTMLSNTLIVQANVSRTTFSIVVKVFSSILALQLQSQLPLYQQVEL